MDVKRVLQEKFPFASTSAPGEAGGAFDAGSELQLGGTAAMSNNVMVVDLERSEDEKAALEARFVDFEGQFAVIRAELNGIVERLQVLEGTAPTLAAEAAAGALTQLQGEETAGMDEYG